MCLVDVDSHYHIPSFDLSLMVGVSMVLTEGTALGDAWRQCYSPMSVGSQPRNSSSSDLVWMPVRLELSDSGAFHQRLLDSPPHLYFCTSHAFYKCMSPLDGTLLLRLVVGNRCQAQSRCSIGKGNVCVSRAQ